MSAAILLSVDPAPAGATTRQCGNRCGIAQSAAIAQNPADDISIIKHQRDNHGREKQDDPFPGQAIAHPPLCTAAPKINYKRRPQDDMHDPQQSDIANHVVKRDHRRRRQRHHQKRPARFGALGRKRDRQRENNAHEKEPELHPLRGRIDILQKSGEGLHPGTHRLPAATSQWRHSGQPGVAFTRAAQIARL